MALIEKLEAIGDAIRAKTGDSALLKLDEMPGAIEGIETGGGGADVEPIVLTDNCSYACGGVLASKYIDMYGNTVSTDAVKQLEYMFHYCGAKNIPFEINCNHQSTYSMNYMFAYSKLQELPMINNAYPSGLTRFCSDANYLRTIPDGFGANWNWNNIQTNAYANCSSLFENCYSLRKVPDSFIKNFYGPQTGVYSAMRNAFRNCYVLDEIVDIPVSTATLTSDIFNNTFYCCGRVKNITFTTNEDGTPKTANWKNQTIEMDSNVGVLYGKLHAYGYNSGITADKEVKDDATYQALKNDADWFTEMTVYSRYNHDSAVNTINSLPDTSAYLAANGGTNTIKFQGASGRETDGGAINTLTDAEIAVAAAKGWTVSLV